MVVRNRPHVYTLVVFSPDIRDSMKASVPKGSVHKLKYCNMNMVCCTSYSTQFSCCTLQFRLC
jgi:hypothetical protein